jgi:stringent starvation protein B
MHEWMVDNDFTPHLVVDARRDGVQVPEEHIKDGKIVLNVSHSATHALDLGNDVVSFEARFGGVPRRLEIPVGAVLGIYARETGQGMLFSDDDSPDSPGPVAGPAAPTSGATRRPKLKVIK